VVFCFRSYSFLLAFVLVTFVAESWAQDKFISVEGTLNTEEGQRAGCFVVVDETDGVGPVRLNTDAEGSFKIKLRFQHAYILSFGKKGYVSQRFAFSTMIPKERIEEGFAPKFIDVVLFKAVEGFAADLMDQAVDRYSYIEDQYDLDRDDAYKADMEEKIKTMRRAMAEFVETGKVSAELAEQSRKDAEEKARAEAIAKRQEEERLAKLRADQAAAEQAERQRIAAEKEAERQQKAEEAAERKRKRQEDEAEAIAEAEAEENRLKQEQAKLQEEAEARRKAEKAAKEAAALEASKAKEKAAAELAAKKTAEDAAREAEQARIKAEKEKAAAELAAKKAAEDAARETEQARIKAEKEEEIKRLAEEAKQKEIDNARKKQEAMAALAQKLKETAEAGERKRLEELAKQEDLFRERSSKFPPVMGIYTTTTSVINGKKAYGYINFGNGLGNQDLTKEEFDGYKERYKKP
jgi:hypothetical protein